jgi:hypothetical protein
MIITRPMITYPPTILGTEWLLADAPAVQPAPLPVNPPTEPLLGLWVWLTTQQPVEC